MCKAVNCVYITITILLKVEGKGFAFCTEPLLREERKELLAPPVVCVKGEPLATLEMTQT